MYRNQYDTDCITWSPQGRLFQVEYAMEAVKQGTCCVAIKSNTHLVLCALKRKVSKFAYVQDKLFAVGAHIGVAMSGITSDAKLLINYMRGECMHHKFLYGCDITAELLVSYISEKSQVNTQISSKRPFGVGLLVAGYDDKNGLTLYETCPSGNVVEYGATAFGSRSQAARTYLERNIESFPAAGWAVLVLHALRALKATLPVDAEFDAELVSVGVLGIKEPFKILQPQDLGVFFQQLGTQ